MPVGDARGKAQASREGIANQEKYLQGMPEIRSTLTLTSALLEFCVTMSATGGGPARLSEMISIFIYNNSIILFFIFMQKHIEEGMTAGAVKG